jgi:hypothetical protein
MAINYLHEVWDSLTGEQRDRADELIYRKSFAGSRRPRASLLSILIPAARAANAAAFDYQQLAADASTAEALALKVSPMKFFVEVDDDPPVGSEYAHTLIWGRLDGKSVPFPQGCGIWVHNQKFISLSPEDARSVITHEMFHCFEQRAIGDEDVWIKTFKPANAWIAEGEATWVMYDMVDGVSPTIGRWTDYVDQPARVYMQRSEDAVGIFGHLQDLSNTGVVWSRMLPILQTAASISGPEAFNELIQGYRENYFTTWGSSYFLASGRKPWTMSGPGPVPSAGPAPEIRKITSQDTEFLTADSDVSALFTLSPSGVDVIGVSLMTGYGRLHDESFGVDTALDTSGPLVLCVKQGGCKCPDGSPGASLLSKDAKPPLSVGINGGDVQARVGVVGDSLDRFCKKPDPPDPPGRPPGGGGNGGGGGDDNQPPKPPPPPPTGRSWGDTHLETYDGLGYDFQVVGEYTLTRSTKDDLEVQVRQVPILGPRVASVTQAAAVRMAGQRITFAIENRELTVLIDGKPMSEAEPVLQSGVLSKALTGFGNTYHLTWLDGTQVQIQQMAGYCINVTVIPSAGRRGSLVGLLGNFDGTADNDLVGKDNVPVHTLPAEVNHTLAAAWAVTDANSLFDYKQGQSSASFVDASFPAQDVDARRLTSYAQARATCQEHGIADQKLLDDCVLDLAATNEFIFGARYAHAQRVLAARAALYSTPAGTASQVFRVVGAIVDSKSEPTFQFTGKKGDVLWVGNTPDCRDADPNFHPVFLALIDPSGDPVRDAGRTACRYGRVELSAAGTYAFRASYHYRNETVHYDVPVRIVHPDRHEEISYGQMIQGNIDEWAAHDVYAWNAKAGDVVVLAGQGCSLPVFTVVLDPAGHDRLGPSCRPEDVFKVPEDGRYQLIVNGAEDAHAPITGPYHFVFQGGRPQN